LYGHIAGEACTWIYRTKTTCSVRIAHQGHCTEACIEVAVLEQQRSHHIDGCIGQGSVRCIHPQLEHIQRTSTAFENGGQAAFQRECAACIGCQVTVEDDLVTGYMHNDTILNDQFSTGIHAQI